MIKVAQSRGFRLTTSLDLDSNERAAGWPRFGLSYTFVMFTLRKDVGSTSCAGRATC